LTIIILPLSVNADGTALPPPPQGEAKKGSPWGELPTKSGERAKAKKLKKEI